MQKPARIPFPGPRHGLGAGLIYVPCVAIQAHRWRTRAALAIGIVFSGFSAGGIVFSIMLNNLLSHGVGFGWTVRASAFVVLGMLFLANLLMRSRSRAINTSRNSTRLIDLFTDLPYMLLILGAAVAVAGLLFPYFYIQEFARFHAVNSTVSFYTLAILNAASIPGRVLPNLFAHSLGIFNVLLLCGFSYAVVMLSLLGISTEAAIIVFAILSGFFSGAFLSLLGGATTSLARHPGEVGLRTGLSFALTALGSLVGAPIAGALLGSDFKWFKPIVFCGVSIVAGSLVLAISRYLLAQRRGTQFV